MEHFDKRHIILFSTSNTLLVLPQSELYKHQSTIEGVAARISQLFQYYMSLSPAILYQSQIPDLIKARQTYHHFQEILELNFYGPIGQLDISSLTIASEVPMLSYKELTSEILSIPTSSRFAYASQRLAELLELCHQQHVMPSRVIQYFVRFLGELEYRTYGVSSAAHDQIADSTDSMRKALTEEELRKDLHNALQSILAPEQSCSTQPLEYSPEVTQALSYIQTSYQHKISLTSVSEHVGLSSGYLCRIFKEETGLSINAYINNLRMTKAGELLKDKNSYIKEVAAAVGFEDQLYFSRLFKRYYGITPSEYRLNE